MTPLDLSAQDLRDRIAARQNYTFSKESTPASRAAASLFGGQIMPLMAHPSTHGRFANAPVESPRGACTGLMEFAPHAASLPYSNEDFVEVFMCLSGSLEIDMGGETKKVKLGKDDLFCVPVGVEHTVRNASGAAATAICFLNGPKESTYRSLFSSDKLEALGESEGASMLGAVAGHPSAEISPQVMAKNTARFAQLKPYKDSLSAETVLPAAAVEYLTASSVYPVLVPEKYNGRNRHAPLRGMAGLNLSIAECTPGDGPLPHAHSQTQETFFALEGEWDVTCGNKQDCHVPLKQHDLVAMPVMSMRTFKNVGESTARLLVIIQQENIGMSDVVAYTPEVGKEVTDRYGAHVLEAFRKTNFEFDADVTATQANSR